MVEEQREVIVEREPRRSSVGTIVAVILGILILLALLMYGLPYLTGGNGGTNEVNVQTPAPTAGTTGE